MFDNLINLVSDVVELTANMGTNTMSTYFCYEPEMPECLVESENE